MFSRFQNAARAAGKMTFVKIAQRVPAVSVVTGVTLLAVSSNNSSACFSWPWESSTVDYEAVYKDIVSFRSSILYVLGEHAYNNRAKSKELSTLHLLSPAGTSPQTPNVDN